MSLGPALVSADRSPVLVTGDRDPVLLTGDTRSCWWAMSLGPVLVSDEPRFGAGER